MRVRKNVRKQLRHHDENVDVVGDVQAAIAINVGEQGRTTSVRSRQRVVQRSDDRNTDKKEQDQ